MNPTNTNSDNLRQEILADVLQLYRCQPSDQCFRHYDEKAEFEDPLQYSDNLSSVKSAFYALPKLFSKSELLKVDPDLSDPTCLKADISTKYYWKLFSKETIINSKLLLFMKDDKIIRHEERWDGEPLPTAQTSMVGRVKENLRHLNGQIVHLLVHD